MKRGTCKKRESLEKFLSKSYTLTTNKNLENFLYKIGVGNEVRQRAINLRPTVRLTKNGERYTLRMVYDERKMTKTSFEPGKPIVRELTNGVHVNSLFVIKGNSLVETQTSEERTIVVTRTFTKDHLIVTMTSNKEKCERFYQLVTKQPDCRSETSRRTITSSDSTSPSTENWTIDSEIELRNEMLTGRTFTDGIDPNFNGSKKNFSFVSDSNVRYNH